MATPNTGDKIFAERLIELRKKRGMTQDDLAALAGLKNSAMIGHFEKSRRSPSMLVLKKVADALETSMDYLTGRSDSPELEDQSALGDSIVARINRTVSKLNPSQKKTIERMINGLIEDK